MTSEKIIQIKGGTYEEVKGALQQWIAVYADKLLDDSQFKLYKNGAGNHIIKPDSRIDNTLFFFLVNYIGYPEGINHKLEVEGFTKGESGSPLADQELLVYNSETDTEHDNVFAVTKENKHFKIDFGGKIEATQDAKSFSPINFKGLKYPEVLKVVRFRMADRERDVVYAEVLKAFNIVAIILLLAQFINFLVFIFTNNAEYFEIGIVMLCLLTSSWLYFEYEIFQFDSLSLKALLIALGLIGYGCLIINYYEPRITEFIVLFFCPLIFLLFQWPTRRLFKMIVKREPKVVDEGTPYITFADLIYTLILGIGYVGIPVFIMLYFY